MLERVERGSRPQGARLGLRSRVGWAEILIAERDRWWLWLPVGVGAGIGLFFALPEDPAVWVAPATLAGTVAVAVLLRRWRTGLGQSVLVALAALSALAVGLTAAQLRTQWVAAPVIEEQRGAATVVGRVLAIEPPGESGKGRRLLLQPQSISRIAAADLPARVRIRLTARDPIELKPGDRIRLPAVLRPPPGPSAPGAFDFARRAYFQGLGGVGYAVGHAALFGATRESDAASADGFWTLWSLQVATLRQAITSRILAAIPGQPGAVAAALITGERGALSAEVKEAMRGSGLAHLLAISGLHVGLVAGFLFFGLRAILALIPPLALNYPIKKWAAAVAALGALIYLLLSGGTVPTQRAFLMIAVVLLAVVLDRTAISLRLVACAALVILIVTPEALLSASFQMSFAAVTALVAAYEAIRERERRIFRERSLARRALLYVAGVALTSVIAILATAPFAAFHFNRLALFGLAANLLAVPLTAFWIMPAAVVGALLMPFGLEVVGLAPMGWGIELLLTVAGTVAGWPGAVLVVQAMPMAGLLAIVLGGLWLCLWRRPWRLLGLLPVAVGIATVPLNSPPDFLASGDGRLLGIRDEAGGLWLSSRRLSGFTAETWIRRSGVAVARRWPADGEAAGPLRCDSLGCLFEKSGLLVAIARDGLALEEDCRRADIVIALVSVPKGLCDQPIRVIDRGDIWRSEGLALWLSDEGGAAKTVAQSRGRRPWARQR
ncbi:MAG: ComEC family competence protein [Kiloniellales bacterium]|nr:ComEC family competence protein [Kiloniellales bacterium]